MPVIIGILGVLSCVIFGFVGPGGPLRRFRAALVGIEATITQRNATRARPYDYLLPSRIPSSTNI